MRRSTIFLALVAVATFPRPLPADWPTLHRDYQRSGFSGEVVKGPFERKWYHSFVEEMIGPRVEAIVAEGLCFVGTYEGNLYALDVKDGKMRWCRGAGGAIGHSPCYHQGRIYVATDAGFDTGSVYCLSAKDGRDVWHYHAGAGIWSSPACDGRRVYVGDRAGVFHAIDAETGRRAWTFQTGAMILKPASFSLDKKRILFGSEDMHVWCLSPEGKLLWKSAKLPGLSLRDAAPTIWDGKVVVRTNPARSFHESLHEGGRLLRQIQQAIPLDPREDKVIVDTENMHFLRRTDRREKAEYEGVLKYLKEHPHSRTWFTLNLVDGKEPWIGAVMYTAGLHNPPTPPAFDPDTSELYTIIPTALGVYCSGVSQVGIGIGRIDPKTGYVTNVAHAHGDVEPGYFAGMPMIADETSTLGLMGDFLVVTHMGAIGGVDLKTRKIRQLWGIRDTYGGLFGPGAHGSWEGSRKLAQQGYVQNTINEWHGPDRSMAAISDGRLFWVVGGCVVCFAGPDVPAAETGGRKPPEPFKWRNMPRIDGGNVTGSLGSYDADLKKKVLDAAAVRKYAEVPPARRQSDAPPDAEVRRRLDRTVLELVDGGPWAPLLVELGISHEELHFWRTSETMQAAAVALPCLSPEVRRKAVAWLDKLFEAGVPLEKPVFGAEGRRREYYDLSPQLAEGPARRIPRVPSDLGDLYALWAYAHYADRWDRVLAGIDAIDRAARDALARPVRFDPDAEDGRAVALLNRQIAGLLGYVRIMRRAGREAEADKALDLLAQMVTERVHFERADPRLQSKRDHHATIPRYLDLAPELGQMLADHAGDELFGNSRDLHRQLPVWHHAWGERLIGGENYTNSPSLARGLFAAAAHGMQLEPLVLDHYLDQPWCRADVYYIEKLTAALRAAGPGSSRGQ